MTDRLSGLQVSFFRAVEVLADELPEGTPPRSELESLMAAAELLEPAMSERQRAQMRRRLDGYLHRRHHAEEARAQRAMREGLAAANYGHRTGAAQCESRRCSAWKPSPSAKCTVCGDEPVSHHGDEREFNRDRGWAA